MINWIKKLFGIHIHEYDNWEIDQVFVATERGVKKIIQKRKCNTCGYIEYDSRVVGRWG